MASPSLNPAAAITAANSAATITSGALTTTVTNTRILAIIMSERTAASVTSVASVTGGQSFTRYGGFSTGTGTTTSFIDVWYFDSSTTFSDTIKATLNTTPGNAIMVCCGVQNFTGFDLNPALPSNVTGSTSPQTITWSTSNPDDLIFACELNSHPSGAGQAGIPAAPTGFTLIASRANAAGAASMAGSVSTLSVSTAQTSQSAPFTIATTVGNPIVGFVFALTSDSASSLQQVSAAGAISTTAKAQPRGTLRVPGKTVSRITARATPTLTGITTTALSALARTGVSSPPPARIFNPLALTASAQTRVSSPPGIARAGTPLALTASMFTAIKSPTSTGGAPIPLALTALGLTAVRSPPGLPPVVPTSVSLFGLIRTGLQTQLAPPIQTAPQVADQVGITRGFLFAPGAGPSWDLQGRAAYPAPPPPPPTVALSASGALGSRGSLALPKLPAPLSALPRVSTRSQARISGATPLAGKSRLKISLAGQSPNRPVPLALRASGALGSHGSLGTPGRKTSLLATTGQFTIWSNPATLSWSGASRAVNLQDYSPRTSPQIAGGDWIFMQQELRRISQSINAANTAIKTLSGQ